ncbi:MAG: oligosaccharide flippase family protein [Saprospiraceae bacterium]
MSSIFVRTATLILGLNLVVKGVYLFGIERVVQNTLPEGDYGLYFQLLNLTMLLQIVADFGLQLYNSRNLAQSRHLLAKYFPWLLGLKLLLGLIFLLSVAAGAWLLRYDTEIYPLLALLAVNQLLMSWLLFLRSNLSGLGRYRADSFISIADKVILIPLVGGLLWWQQPFTVYHFAGAQLLAWLISGGLVLYLLRNRLERMRPRWNPATGLVLLRRAAPFALAIFLMTAYTRLDAVMLGRLLPGAAGRLAADHYAAAYRLLDAANMLGFLLAGLLLPMFARLLARRETIRSLFALSLRSILTLATLAAFPLLFFARPVVQLLYTIGDAETARVLIYLMLTYLTVSAGYVFGTLLGAADRLRNMNYVFAAGVLLNLGLNLYLIPRRGAAGAALATLVTQTMMLAGQMGLAYAYLPLRGAPLRLGRLLIFWLVFGASGYLLSRYSPLGWFVNFCVCVCCGLGPALALRLLDPRAWRKADAGEATEN